ncbi:MAG: hypothetical protein Kow00108_03480 [Calditrichia bacterium]
MKKLLQSLLIVLGILNFVVAQPTSDESLASNKAIQFSIEPNFSIKSIDGSMISFKYYFHPNTAIRVGISPGYSNSNSKDKYLYYSPVDTTLRKSDNEHGAGSFALNSYIIRTLVNNKKIRPYVGAGPYISFSNSDLDRKLDSFDTLKVETNQESFGFGIGTVLGAEWQISSQISIFAEYGLRIGVKNISYSEKDYLLNNINNYELFRMREEESSTFSVASLPVRLGVAIYF